MTIRRKWFLFFFSFLIGITSLFGDIHDDLLKAAQEGRPERVEALLQKVGNINTTDTSSATPLIYASMNGHTEVVKLLLEAGADVHNAENGGYTPLIAASAQGHLGVVKLLLDAGADPESEGPFGNTVLIDGVVYGKKEIVRLLLEAGADPRKDSRDSGLTPLEYAVILGHPEITKDLYEAHFKQETEEGREGNRGPDNPGELLYTAAGEGHPETVKVLLDLGITVDTRFGGKTALMAAALAGHSDVAELLIRRGAEQDARDDQGRTALMAALRGGDRETLGVLLRGGADPRIRDTAGRNALDFAVELKKPELGDYISQGIDGPEKVEVNPFYALFNAVAREKVTELENLLQGGTDPDARGPGETTALITAAVLGRTDAIKLLLQYGADANATDEIGSSALAWVVKNGNMKGLKLLADAGADPNHGAGEDPAAGLYDGSRKMKGITPIAHAVDRAAALVAAGGEEEKAAATEIVKKLLDISADPEGSIPASRGGSTPILIEAVKANSFDLVKALLTVGADPDVLDKGGRTPLSLAAEKGHIAIVKTLISYGADIRATDKTGKSVLLYAIDRRQGEIVELLMNGGMKVSEAARVVSGNGESALFAAAWESRLLLAKKLCVAGAEVDQLNNNEETPLMVAAEKGDTKMVALLLQFGADPNRMGKYNKTPLNAAAGSGKTEIVQTLIAAGAVVRTEADQGERALAQAVAVNKTDMAELLLAHGAEPSFIHNTTGDTLLIIAAKWGNPRMIELLLSMLEEEVVKKKNYFGRTALDVAGEYGFPEVEGLLIEAGAENAKSDAENGQGKEKEKEKGKESGNNNFLLSFRPDGPLSFLQKGKKNYASGKYQLAKLNFLEAHKAAVLYWKPFKRPVEAAMAADLFCSLGKTEMVAGYPERALLWFSMALDQWYDRGEGNFFSLDFLDSDVITRWPLVDLLWNDLEATDGLISSYPEADRVERLTILAHLLNPESPEEIIIDLIEYLIKPNNGWLRKIYDPKALILSIGDFEGEKGPSIAYLRQLSGLLHNDMGGSGTYSYTEEDTLSDPMEVLPLFLRQLSYVEKEYPQVPLNEYYNELALYFFYQGRPNVALHFLEKTGPVEGASRQHEFAGRSVAEGTPAMISSEILRYLVYSSQDWVDEAYHHLLKALDHTALSGHSLLFAIISEMGEDYGFLEDLLFQEPFEKDLITLEMDTQGGEDTFVTFDLRAYPRLHQFRLEYLNAREMLYSGEIEKSFWEILEEAAAAHEEGKKAEADRLLKDALEAFGKTPPQYDDIEDLLEVAEDFYFEGFPEQAKIVLEKVRQVLSNRAIIGDDYAIPDFDDMQTLGDDFFSIALMILLDSDAPEELEEIVMDQWREFSAVLAVPFLFQGENIFGDTLPRFLKEAVSLFLTLGKVDRSLDFQHTYINFIEDWHRSIALEDRNTPSWYGYPVEGGLVNAYHNRAVFQTTRGQYNQALTSLVETWQGDLGFSGRHSIPEKVYLNLGMLCQSWGLFEEAQGYLERALSVVSAKKDKNSYITQASILNNLAVLRLSFMELEQA